MRHKISTYCILRNHIFSFKVNAAVQAAKAAFPMWSSLSPQDRSAIMNKLADLIESHMDEFALAESRDQGDTDDF